MINTSNSTPVVREMIWNGEVYTDFGIEDMMEKEYNKLVRDKIPEIIKADGKICETEILSADNYINMIDAKLNEELEEYHKDKSLEELADLIEVIYAATTARGYSIEDLEHVRKKKIEERGSFNNRILLKKVIG